MPKSYIDNFSKEELQKIARESQNMIEVAQKLGYSTYAGSTQKVIAEKLDELGINRPKIIPSFKIRDDSTIFVKNSTASQHCLRDHYIKINPPIKCDICGQPPEWQGKPLILILDHIDGDHFNDELTNLRWVCPNCNQQLDTTGYKAMRVKNQKAPKKVFAGVKVKCIETGDIFRSYSAAAEWCETSPKPIKRCCETGGSMVSKKDNKEYHWTFVEE